MNPTLRRSFQRALETADSSRLEHGWFGKRNADGTFTIRVNGLPAQYAYVRIVRGTATTLTTAINYVLDEAAADAPIILRRGPQGLEVVGVDHRAAQTNERVSYLAGSAHQRQQIVETQRLRPGLVHAYKEADGSYGLRVYIEPFFYAYQGANYYWPGGIADLTAYVPPTSSQQALVLVGLDPASNTPVAALGTEYALTFDLAASPELIANITFGGYYPLSAVVLQNGQTAIDEGKLFVDARHFLTGLDSGGGGGTGSASGFDVDAAPDPDTALDDEFDDASFDVGLWTEYDSGAIQTIAEASGNLSLSQGSQAAATVTGVYQAIPAGDFAIVCKLRIDHDTTGAGKFIRGGLVVWEDAADNAAPLIVFGPGEHSSSDGFGHTQFSDYNSIIGTPVLDGTIAASTWYYLRLRRSGSSYYFDHSTDGLAWTVLSGTHTIPFTPTHFGLGLYNQATAYTLQADVEFFRYRAVFDSVTDPVYGRDTSFVLVSGDSMTGELAITVATANENALTLKTSDDNTTNPLLLVTDSADNVQVSIGATGAVVINEEGNDADFRVEGDTAASLLHADASADRVGINTPTPATRLDVVGNTRLGDSATNYAAFDTDGDLTLVGTARVKREIEVEAIRARTGAAAPTETVRAIGASGGVRMPVYSFSKTLQNDLDITFHAQHDTDGSVNVAFHIMWIPGAAWSAGNYMWKLEYLVKSQTDDMTTGAPTTISADVTPSDAIHMIESAFSDTIDLGPDQVLYGHFYRDVANDNGDDTGELVFMEIEYTANRLGEAT